MRASNLLALAFCVAGLAPSAGSAEPIKFEFPVDKDCTTSAGVYTADGQLVRVLWSLKKMPAGTQSGTWDGLDDVGRSAPPGAYEVRLACGNPTYASVGTIGNSGVGNTMQAGTDDLIVDPASGDIYTANNWEEAGQDFRKTNADGKHLMDAQFGVRNGTPNGWPIAVAYEDGVLYCSVFTVNDEVPGQDKRFTGGQVLRKFTADKGEPLKFPTETGYIRVRYPDPKDTTPFDHQSLHSITICGDAIVAADRWLNKVYKFDKKTGKAAGEFDMPRPVCVITDHQKRLWIANDGSKITVVDLDGEVLARPEVQARQIVNIRFGKDSTLWVGDQDAGAITVYKIEAGDKLTKVRSYGRKAKPGESSPLALVRLQTFDVMPDGGFVMAQSPGHGTIVTRFDPAGAVIWQQVGLEFCTNGTIDPKQPDLFISTLLHAYRIEDFGKGKWRYEGNLLSGLKPEGTQSTGTPRILELGKNRFYFELTGDVVRVYRFDGPRLVPAALVGVTSRAWDSKVLGDLADKDKPTHFVWRDANGDGLIQADEITRDTDNKKQFSTFSCEVDNHGDIIIPDHGTRAIFKLPLARLDERGNPVYEWSGLKEIVPADQTARALRPMKACPLPDGGMYVLQAAEMSFYPPIERQTGYGKPHQVCWMGGWVFSKHDKDGRRLFTVPLPDHCTGLDYVPNADRTAELGVVAGVYTAEQLYHYTPDGLLVGVMKPAHKTGWLDHNGSVSICRNKDGLADVFAEESLCNRISWYRMDDRDIRTLKVAIEKMAAAGETYATESQFLEALGAGKALASQGKLAEAVESCKKALLLACPRETALARVQLARAYSGNRQSDEAIAEYERLIHAPGFEDYQRGDMVFTIAGIQRQQKNYDAAVATLGRVKSMKLPPDRQFEPRAMAEIAGLYFAAGKDAGGMEQLRKLKDLCQSNKQYARSGYFRQAYTMTAEQLRRQSKLDEAIKEYQQSLQVKDLEEGCYASDETAMAECYLAMKDLAAAARHFTAAGTRYPKADRDLRIRACLRGGDCQRDLGKKEGAATLYQQVLDMPDASPEQKKTARLKLEQMK